MTRFDDLDRALASYFDVAAMAPQPEGLLELITSSTARQRPRPAWQARLNNTAVALPGALPNRSRLLLIGVAVLLALAAAVVVGGALFQRSTTIENIFRATGHLPDETAHGATSARLSNGHVVIAGGIGSVTLYDPTTGVFSTIPVPALISNAAVASADGSALLFGQDIRQPDGLPGISVVRIDARTRSVSPILASSAVFGDVSAESGYVALRDGRILIVGQTIRGPGVGTIATLFYDPSAGTFVRGPASVAIRAPARAIALTDGRILLIDATDIGGEAPQVVSVLDPMRGAFVAGETIDSRDGYTATVLADGRVLLAGGASSDRGGLEQTVLDTALIVDPRGAAPSVAGAGPLPEGRWMHGAALLGDGRVLLVGGDLAPASPFQATSSTVLFDPTTNAFVRGPAMVMPRIAPKVVPLADGRILVAGHYGLAPNASATGAELTAEVFR